MIARITVVLIAALAGVTGLHAMAAIAVLWSIAAFISAYPRKDIVR
jgi:hypothetical protein